MSSACRDGHRRRPLPELEPSPRRGRGSGAPASGRGRSRRPGRGRIGLERARRPLSRGEAESCSPPGTGRRRGDDGPRGAAARHPRRGSRAGPRRHRLARAGQVAPTSPSGGRTGSSWRARAILSPASCSRGHAASTGCSWAARRSFAAASSCGWTKRRSPASTAPRRGGSKRDRLALDPRPRHGRRTPGGGRAGRALRAEALVAAAETGADGRVPELAGGLEPGVYRLVFHPPSPFFRSVALEFELEDGHYHVPLVASPYGCATYRGS